MSLLFVCNTCGKKFDAQVRNSAVTYQKGSRIVELKDENHDCEDCEKEITKRIQKAREEAQRDIRAKL